jgi:Fe-S oxidoreductase
MTEKTIEKKEKKPADRKKMVESFKKKVNRQSALSFSICAHCGMCTDSCHYYLAKKDPKMSPAYKADMVRKLYKKHVDWTGRVIPKWVGAKTLESEKQLQEMKDVLFGSCTICRRCTVNCPMGVDKALLIRTGRALFTEAGIAPEGVMQVSRDQWNTGNQMAVTQQDYLETLDWLSDELEAEMGDPAARIPIDKLNANVVYLVNPREVKYAP